MKIAISGKGGVGKTYISGVLSEFFVKKGFKVLAIDADSSPNLALTLGMSTEQSNKIVPVSENQQLIKSKTQTGFAGVYNLSFKVDDVVKNFGVATPYGVNLLVMGGVKSASGGCTCPANALIRALLRHLLVERDEAIVMDMEAGLEHLGRGTARHMDTMLIVTDPSFKSMEIAKKIHILTIEMGVKRTFIVGNKIHNSEEANLIKRFTVDNKIPLLELVPYDADVFKADVRGETPIKYANSLRSIQVISKMGGELLKYGFQGENLRSE